MWRRSSFCKVICQGPSIKYSHPKALTLHWSCAHSAVVCLPQPLLAVCLLSHNIFLVIVQWSIWPHMDLNRVSSLTQVSHSLVLTLICAVSKDVRQVNYAERKRETDGQVSYLVLESHSPALFPSRLLSRSIKCNLCRQKASGYKERLHPVGKSVPVHRKE